MQITNKMAISRWMRVFLDTVELEGIVAVDTTAGTATSCLGPELRATDVVFEGVPPEHRVQVAQVCAQIDAEAATNVDAMTARLK